MITFKITAETAKELNKFFKNENNERMTIKDIDGCEHMVEIFWDEDGSRYRTLVYIDGREVWDYTDTDCYPSVDFTDPCGNDLPYSII